MPTDVRLRPVREDDLPIFLEQQADPDAFRMANFSPRDEESFMAHWAKILRDATTVVRTIEFEGRVAGNVVSWEHDGERDIGYWIGREHWGKGVATAALSAFLDEVGIRPLRARVADHNIGSIRVLEKCGFTRRARTVLDGTEESLFELGP